MKECNKCSVELVVGENITISQLKNWVYMCKSCRSQYHKSDVFKASLKKYKQSPQGKKKNNESIKRWIYKKQGVYGIFSGETCLYVGESSQLNKRISIHKTCIKKPEASTNAKQLYIRISQHNDIYFKVLEETKRHKQREGYYITTLKPLYNAKG